MVNLTQTARDSQWHLATTINSLVAEGIDRAEAVDFAEFIFAEEGEREPGLIVSEIVNDEQWDRLSVERDDWFIDVS